MGVPIFSLVAIGGTWHLFIHMTLCHDIKLFHQYLASSGVDTTYDLGVLPPGVGTTVTC